MSSPGRDSRRPARRCWWSSGNRLDWATPRSRLRTTLAAWLSGPDAPENVSRVLLPGRDPERGAGLLSSDGATMYLFVEVAGEPAEQPFIDTVNEIRERSAAFDLPGVQVAVGGPGGLVADLVGVFAQIDTILLLVTVLLVLVLLGRNLPLAGHGTDSHIGSGAGLPALRGGWRLVCPAV